MHLSGFINTIIFWSFLVVCSMTAAPAQSQQISLNEVMASNSNTIADEDGDYSDWIEIYNYGSEPVQLQGIGLSDDPDNRFRWTFPDTTLQAETVMLVWASNKNRKIPGEPLHTNFAVSAGGEELSLTHPDGTPIDVLEPVEISSDLSFGRIPDGTGNWNFFNDPTPGELNSTEPISGILDVPQLSAEPGFYTSEFELTITHPDENVTIYYTTDGSKPTTESAIVTGPLSVRDRNNDPNYFSTIPTNFMTSWRGWRAPTRRIPKGSSFRFMAVKNGFEPAFSSATYFVSDNGRNSHTLPVISITTDSLHLFSDETGIYVPGNAYEEGNHSTGNYNNRGREWEREVAFEFFNENGVRRIDQTLGVRIHGGHTRRFEQKSLRLYARGEYGESYINYPVFPEQDYDSYKRLMLRNSGNDQGQTMLRDAAAHTIVRHFDMDTQAYRPAVVYINGEYWGLHNIRERYDDHYLERVYDINPDRIDLLTDHWTVEEGDNQQYAALLTYIENNNLANETHYDYVKTRIDIDNFLDYYTAQIYFANTDWPHNNIDFWRSHNPFSPSASKGQDGRWRWLFYDLDYTFGLVEEADFDMLHWVTRREAADGREWSNRIVRNLLENEEFKHAFINRLADHLNTSFRTDRVLGIIKNIKETIDPEMDRSIERWYSPRSKQQWEEFLNPVWRFAQNRSRHLQQHIQDHFGIESTEEVTINIAQPDLGTVNINSLIISPETEGIDDNPFPWTGTYFSGIPVRISANANPAYQLSHWVVDGERINTSVLVIDPGDVSIVSAHFQPASFPDIEPHNVENGYYLFTEWNDDELAGTFPDHMVFVFMDEHDPGLDAEISGTVGGEYNLNSRTRINGLGDDGFSFINTGNEDGNPGFPGRQLGGAILALDTRTVNSAEIGWRAGTVNLNSRVYRLRLQYRTEADQPFIDLPGEDGSPLEYIPSEESGHNEFIGTVPLPDDAMDQPNVELLWRYYYTGERLDENSGQRSELYLSEIFVSAVTESSEPTPYTLTDNGYSFTHWPADAEFDTTPEAMEFVFMDETDPGLNANILGYTGGLFNLDSRTRVNGLGEEGISFVNTGNLEGNDGIPGRRLGGALLAIDTKERGSITVEWTGGTVEPNSRVYNLRLQYRVGNSGEFKDVSDQTGHPLDYIRNENSGHSQKFETIQLPPETDNQPLVQLFWRYYYTGERLSDVSGARSRLRLDNIFVDSEPLLGGDPGVPNEFVLYQNYPNPFYPYSTIRYDLPSDQNVSVDLFTISGRHIGTLFHGFKKAGRHSVHVDGASLASGIYLYRISTDDYKETRKMSIIK